MIELRVELYGHRIGDLRGKDASSFDFYPNPDAFGIFNAGSTVLSEAIPLEPKPNRSQATRRRNFFAELLPEGRILENLANRIRVSTSDTLGLLAHYGRDVAGSGESWA